MSENQPQQIPGKLSQGSGSLSCSDVEEWNKEAKCCISSPICSSSSVTFKDRPLLEISLLWLSVFQSWTWFVVDGAKFNSFDRSSGIDWLVWSFTSSVFFVSRRIKHKWQNPFITTILFMNLDHLFNFVSLSIMKICQCSLRLRCLLINFFFNFFFIHVNILLIE